MNTRIFPTLSAVCLSALIGACSTTPLIYPEQPPLGDAAAKALLAYKNVPGKKAFAASSGGVYAYSKNEKTDQAAIRSALGTCQQVAAGPCRLVDQNDHSVESAYRDFGAASGKAIANLRISGAVHIALENLDWQIPAPTRLRTLSEGIHFATPTALDGITTISTAALVEEIKTGKMVLIDTLGLGDTPNTTLPNSYSIDYAGLAFGDAGQNTYDAQISANLQRVMPAIAPNKDQPVTVFCASAECWLSVNALLRLQALGYTNLYWYRGGVQAWVNAKLPTVSSVPFATAYIF